MNELQSVDLHRSGGYWTIRKTTVKMFGDFILAGVFSEVLEQKVMSHHLEWFTFTYEQISERMCIPHNKVQSCVQQLLEMGLFSRERRGIPSVYYYRYNSDSFDSLMDTYYNSIKFSSVRNDSTTPVRNPEHSIRETKTRETDEEPKDCSSSEGAGAPKGAFLRRPKKAPSIFGNDVVEGIFNHWNNLADPIKRHKPDPTSKVFQNSLLAINRALKTHTSDEIKQSMDNYQRLLNDRDTKMYYPTQSKRWGLIVSLPEFFKFSDHTEEQMLKHKEVDIPDNWFGACNKGYEYLQNLYAKYNKDDNPKITDKLEEAYKKSIPGFAPTIKSRNIFIRCAVLVLDYHNKNKARINWNSCPIEKISPHQFAHRIVDACLDSANNDPSIISPEWLCGPKMFTERLPKYLKKIGLLTQDQQVKRSSGDITLSSLMGEDY